MRECENVAGLFELSRFPSVDASLRSSFSPLLPLFPLFLFLAFVARSNCWGTTLFQTHFSRRVEVHQLCVLTQIFAACCVLEVFLVQSPAVTPFTCPCTRLVPGQLIVIVCGAGVTSSCYLCLPYTFSEGAKTANTATAIHRFRTAGKQTATPDLQHCAIPGV